MPPWHSQTNGHPGIRPVTPDRSHQSSLGRHSQQHPLRHQQGGGAVDTPQTADTSSHAIPSGLSRLKELSLNLWWSWTPEARRLFEHIDTDVTENSPENRALSARLYGGDQEMRLCQEFLLGIGGVRMLRALGIAH